MISFRSKITEKVLGYYFMHPKNKKYTNELAKLLHVDVGNLDRKLKELCKEGLFTSETKGNQRYYFLNADYILFREIQRIFNVKYGLVPKLKAIATKIKGLQQAYIFGSYAKQTMGEESDIDVLLIGDHKPLDAKKRILPLQEQYRREFNIVDMSEKELLQRQEKEDPFVTTIFHNSLIQLFP